MAEKMNITQHYDELADILYIDFGSDEPCFTEPISGVVMLDIGWFSKLPRGVKIISPKANQIKAVGFKVIITQVKKACRNFLKQQAKQIETEESELPDILSQRLSQSFTHVGK
jgi:hypothetical protein